MVLLSSVSLGVVAAVLPLNPKSQRPFSSSVDRKKQAPEGEQNSLLIITSFDRIKRAIYDLFQKLNDPDTKTAIKIGAGAAFMIFPAFWDLTRPTFHRYRAQWAVVTVRLRRILFSFLFFSDEMNRLTFIMIYLFST